MKFGDESELETKLSYEGRKEELKDSEKNKITDFSDAHERGNGLIDAMSDMPELPKKKMPMMKKEKTDELQD